MTRIRCRNRLWTRDLLTIVNEIGKELGTRNNESTIIILNKLHYGMLLSLRHDVYTIKTSKDFRLKLTLNFKFKFQTRIVLIYYNNTYLFINYNLYVYDSSREMCFTN